MTDPSDPESSGAGSLLVVEQAGEEPLHAVVDYVGLFSTRLRDATSTLHVPNGSLQLVRNLSQQAQSETLRLRVGENPEFDPSNTALHPRAASILPARTVGCKRSFSGSSAPGATWAQPFLEQ